MKRLTLVPLVMFVLLVVFGLVIIYKQGQMIKRLNSQIAEYEFNTSVNEDLCDKIKSLKYEQEVKDREIENFNSILYPSDEKVVDCIQKALCKCSDLRTFSFADGGEARANMILADFLMKENPELFADLGDEFELRSIAYEHDFNDDGIPEIIGIEWRLGCGNKSCAVFILQKNDVGYEDISHISAIGYEPITVLKTKTNGYHDLKVTHYLYDSRLDYDIKYPFTFLVKKYKSFYR